MKKSDERIGYFLSFVESGEVKQLLRVKEGVFVAPNKRALSKLLNKLITDIPRNVVCVYEELEYSEMRRALEEEGFRFLLKRKCFDAYRKLAKRLDAKSIEKVDSALISVSRGRIKPVEESIGNENEDENEVGGY